MSREELPITFERGTHKPFTKAPASFFLNGTHERVEADTDGGVRKFFLGR